ncbi:MAG: transposase [Planctomycetota bacterium]|jgi:hypothetical protein
MVLTNKNQTGTTHNDNIKWIVNSLSYYKRLHKRESSHQLWQEEFHPQQIMSEQMLVQKIDYIHSNPVKRGNVLRPEYWAHSSATDFLTAEEGYIRHKKSTYYEISTAYLLIGVPSKTWAAEQPGDVLQIET